MPESAKKNSSHIVSPFQAILCTIAIKRSNAKIRITLKKNMFNLSLITLGNQAQVKHVSKRAKDRYRPMPLSTVELQKAAMVRHSDAIAELDKRSGFKQQ
jgi:DNA topoisomerase IA